MEFDKNVPIPKAEYGRPNATNWSQMQIGDSHFFANNENTGNTKRSTIGNAMIREGFKYVTRSVVEDGVKGIRVWRTE